MTSRQEKAPSMESQILRSEEVLRVKQEQVQKFIEANYSKILDRQKDIQQVEAELALLQLEAKQTVNPRKQALEFLRKKIEQQGERASQAKARELQAKKAYEHAAEIARAEEAEKERLSKELQALVHETASSQLERLEQLTRRLEILSGGAHSLLQPSRETNSGSESSEKKQAISEDVSVSGKMSQGGDGAPLIFHEHVNSGASSGSSNGHGKADESSKEQHAQSSKQSRVPARMEPLTNPLVVPQSNSRTSNGRLAQTTGGGRRMTNLSRNRTVEGTANNGNQWTGGGFDVK